MAQEGLPDAWTLWRIPSRALGQTHVPKFAGPGKFRMKGNFTREGPMRPVGFVWHEEMVNLRRSHKASGDASDRLTWDVAQQDGDVLPRDAWGTLLVGMALKFRQRILIFNFHKLKGEVLKNFTFKFVCPLTP